MRKQRSGHVISISSSAGLSGFEFGTAYAASKFGLEGWMESLNAEVAPFGINTTIVNPGFFRTELLTEQSTNFAAPSIEDYDERRTKQLEFWKAQNGQQAGDPAKLARALITIANQEPPPRRFIAGADAIGTAEQRVADLKGQIQATAICRHRWHSIEKTHGNGLCPPYLACRFVVAQRNELGVAEVIFACPFQGLDLRDQHRFQPTTVRHLRCR
jgi:hypothetical protein